MIDAALREMGASTHVRMCPSSANRDRHLSILPEAHSNLLARANGVSAADGYVRLFGVACPTCPDVTWWNDEQTWKFAWHGRASKFLCFGETGWGDQYAYEIEGLRSGNDRVLLLDSFEMEAEEIAPNFERFLAGEFLRQLERPYDSMSRAALENVGALAWDELVTYVPSPLLSGDETPSNIVKMPSRSLMIVNGDLATQLSMEPGRAVERVETYADERGLRLRVLWSE